MKKSGFTIIELVIALTLFSVALAAMMTLISMLLTAQIKESRGLGAQGDSQIAVKSLRLDLAQATVVSTPTALGRGDVLAGCANYDPSSGSGAAGVLLSGQPNWSFYYCVDSSDTLYRYSASGPAAPCPPVAPAACGAGNGLVLAKNFRHAPDQPAFFSRAGSGLPVEFHYQTGAQQTRQVDTAIASLGAR